MFEVTIIIPVADNDGDCFPETAFETFEAVVVARFGGITRYPSTAVGTWVDGGVTYRDESRFYGIAVGSLTDGSLIGEVVEFAKRHFRQEAIFIRYLGIVEIL